MGLIDVADKIAADFTDRGVTATVFYGPEFEAQDDAAFRVVIVPGGPARHKVPDRYDLEHHMGGLNPRPIRTRHAGALVQIWASNTNVAPGPLKQAADWRALDLLINAFLLSLHMVSGPNNYELGAGAPINDTPHSRYGAMYEQIRYTMPIAVRPNATAASGNSKSMAASVPRSRPPHTAKSPDRQSWNEIASGCGSLA